MRYEIPLVTWHENLTLEQVKALLSKTSNLLGCHTIRSILRRAYALRSHDCLNAITPRHAQ